MKKRRILVAIIIIAVLLVNTMPVYAETEPSPGYSGEHSLWAPAPEGTDKGIDMATHLLIQQGAILAKQRVYRYLNVNRLAQDNSSWKNIIMQSRGLSIDAAGCVLTSFTMVARYYGSTHTPAQVNTVMGNYACGFGYDIAASRYNLGIDIKWGPSNTNAINIVIASIANGKPAMVAMERGNQEHTVVAYGYTGNNVSIRDPESHWPTPYASLNAYFNDGWTVERIAIYG